jgi:ankyrin repeat protein
MGGAMKRVTTIFVMVLLTTPLMLAVGCGGMETTETEIPYPGYLGEELLETAEEGDVQEVRSLIEEGADVNARDEDDFTPLHVAAEYGHTDVAALLIEWGADVNAQDDMGWTPLHKAAIWSRTEAAAVLLERGADVNVRDDEGCTPLRVSTIVGYTEVAELLRRHGGTK